MQLHAYISDYMVIEIFAVRWLDTKLMRKLAGRSPGNDDKVSIICFPQKLMEGSVRSENEARILYTVEKGFIWQSKRAHLEKFPPPRYARRITFHFF